jgi:hypothetical protein
MGNMEGKKMAEKINLKEVFKEYAKIYEGIFQNIYPATGNNGFTEHNQTVVFSKAFESVHRNSFSWFELPIKNGHIDAIIFNTSSKEIFIIEAKRFSMPKKKIASVASDIERISKIKEKEYEIFKTQFNDYTYHGVILADVWTESDNKNKIFDSWGKGFFSKTKNISTLRDEKIIYVENKLNNADWDNKKGFNDEDHLCDPNGKDSIRKEYKLLMMTWKF